MTTATAVRTRPIPFSDPMVLAIQDGRKTQTRRVVQFNSAGRVQLAGRQWHIDDPNAVLACPYGQPGDHLYVREAWQYADWTDEGEPLIRYRADGAEMWHLGVPDEWEGRLTDIWEELSRPANYEIDGRAADRRWRPPMFMPRWASRTTLEITDVRVERIQAITAEDCIAEGLSTTLREHDAVQDLRGQFAALWDSINEPRGYGWNANPWVWCLTFREVV